MASLCLVLGFFLCFLSSSTPQGSTGTAGTFTLAAAAAAPVAPTEKAQQKAASHPNTRGGAVRCVQEVEVDAAGEMEAGGEEEDDEEEGDDEEEEGDDEDEEEGDDEDEEGDDEEEDDGEEDNDEEDEEEEEEKPVQEPYVLDDVASEDGDLRGTLILDEISEFSEVNEEGPGGSTKYFKVCRFLCGYSQLIGYQSLSLPPSLPPPRSCSTSTTRASSPSVALLWKSLLTRIWTLSNCGLLNRRRTTRMCMRSYGLVTFLLTTPGTLPPSLPPSFL